ncbi:MAG: hypothetical protein AAGF19_08495 [Pseudomonadota bacterium]
MDCMMVALRILSTRFPKSVTAFGTVLVLCGCGATVATDTPRPASLAPAGQGPAPYATTGTMVGARASAIIETFGAPGLERREGEARILQFTSQDCVLMVFAYPQDGTEIVTYAEVLPLVDLEARGELPQIPEQPCLQGLAQSAATLS